MPKAATAGDDPVTAAGKINKIVEDERASIHNDSSPDTDPYDDVDENPSSHLDDGNSAPRPDRLKPSDSGSSTSDAGDDSISDLTDGISDDDDMSEITKTLTYLFMYFDMLSTPEDAARDYNGSVDDARDHAKRISDWFSRFSSSL